MKPFLIIRTGGTFPETIKARGDFEDWTIAAMGLSEKQCEIVDVQKGETLPDPKGFSGCAITGSHDMVTDPELEWIKPVCSWLKDATAAGLPIMGICFGHQLLAHALGGETGFHPDGPEIGTFTISLTDEADTDPLFSLLSRAFPGHTTHYQTALKLPAGSVVLAQSDHEPHQAFRYGKCCWGVQFHPEFNAEDMRTYIVRQEDVICEHGGDMCELLCEVKETKESTGLLAHFVEYCRTNR